MAIAEVLRKKVVSDLLRVPTVARCWPTWQQAIRAISGSKPSATEVLVGLGDNLRAIFATTATAGRSQGELSGGGTAWEGLVCWYLNLCLIGTRAVVVKKSSDLPLPVRDALTLSYGSSQTNTESDLVAITFPEISELDNFTKPYLGQRKLEIDRLVSNIMGQVEVCVLQCKTNWNDNSQIPMLWDLVYSSRGFSESSVSIGRNSHSVRTLKRFAYAFITLPSNNPATFQRDSMPVLRVSKLSGGNFWGCERKRGVAAAISDIFTRNFETATQIPRKPWKNHFSRELEKLNQEYSYFKY